MTVGKVQGGEAFNVIPDSVTIGGTFRAFSMESVLQLKQRIEEVLSVPWHIGCAYYGRIDWILSIFSFFPFRIYSKFQKHNTHFNIVL